MWWRLAFLDLPMLWLLNAVSVALHPARLITRTCAIALSQCADGADEHRAGSLPLLALIVADLGIVLLGPLILVASVTTPGWVATATFAWTLLLIAGPTLTYCIPALVQHGRGRGLKHWCTTTEDQTGRTPVAAFQLAAWPCSGGGREGTGAGFDLIRALATDARRRGRILVGVARSSKLAKEYGEKTNAESSPHNPRHLRWP